MYTQIFGHFVIEKKKRCINIIVQNIPFVVPMHSMDAKGRHLVKS